MKKRKKLADRILATAISTAFTLSFVPVPAFAEQVVEESYNNIINTEETTETELKTTKEEQISDSSEIYLEETEENFTDTTTEISKNYQILINIPEEIRNTCTVIVNGKQEGIFVQENEVVTLKAMFSNNNENDEDDKNYEIETISIGNMILCQNIDISERTTCESKITINESLADENGNIIVNVILSKYLFEQDTVLTKSNNQDIVSDSNDNNIITNQFQITGGRNDEAGRVSFYMNSEDDNFNPELYDDGVETLICDYDKTAVVYIQPNENFYIKSIRINGEIYQQTLTQNNNGYYFSIENVTQDMQVDVEILEREAIWISLPEKSDEYTCYNSDVILTVASESNNFSDFISGIYWVDGSYEKFLLNMDTKQIVVPKETNHNNIAVWIQLFDKYGQSVKIKSDTFNINYITPKISIVIDGQKQNEDSAYYYTERTATILIDDREYTFPTTMEGFANLFKITKNGQELSIEEKIAMLQYDRSNYQQLTSDGIAYDRVTAYLYFRDDAEYDWEFNYTNLAGITTQKFVINAKNPHHFIIDKTAPEGSIIIEQNIWNQLLEKITFGFFNKKEITVTIDSQDFTSVNTAYYISNSTDALTWTELDNIPEKEWQIYSNSFTLAPPKRFVIYAKLIDASGNCKYISSNGHIIDNESSAIILDFTENKIYTEDVKVKINVNDKIETEENKDENIYSGIKKVEYWLKINGEETESTTLYEFSGNLEELLSEWSSEITIPAERNNNSNVILYVKVIDNAGNEKIEQHEFNIDIDEPIVSISYEDSDGNQVQPENEKYFNGERIAVIQIEERNFSKEAVEKGIKINGKSLADVLEEPESDWNWQLVGQDEHWKHDYNANIHETKVKFSEDGDYQFDIIFTDEAGNSTEVHPNFVIDKSKPKAEISFSNFTWNSLVNGITFGIFKKDETTKVKITARSDRSIIQKIEYYLYKIQKNEEHVENLTQEELEALAPEAWTLYTEPFYITKYENISNVVYAKVTDMAGNVSYISSNGYIYDDMNCEINLTPDNTNAIYHYNETGEHVYYHDDVTVNIEVKDYFPYSGIKSVEYWVTVNGERTVDDEETISGIYQAENKQQESDKNKEYDIWTETITIPYNNSNIELHVKAEDFSGNIKEEVLELDIDKTAPEIEISYDNNKGNLYTDGRYYFSDVRTATIKFKKRSNHFSEIDARNSITISDIYGTEGVETTYQWGEWNFIEGTSFNHDDDIHVITVQFYGDANYHIDIDYSDIIGYHCSNITGADNSIGLYDFTVDRTQPFGTVTAFSNEGREETWDELVNPLSFGFWSKSNIQILWETVDDITSPIKSIEYYPSTSTVALTESELRNIKNWTAFNFINLSWNGYSTVYVKITDFAGNSAYISTNALIVDDSAPYDEMIPPDISITQEQSQSGIHNSDVSVHVVVNEPSVNEVYSGLKSISYRVLNMGQETASGVLYTFDAVIPQYNELLQTWEGDIVISSEQNNSNDIVLEIYAQDNAENYSVESLALSIDVTPPEITISFDNNTPLNDLFKSNRTARISITERNFSADYINITTTHNGVEYKPTVAWTQSGGTGNGDNTVWYTDIPFSNDGEYTFQVDCSDLAANKSGTIQYANDTVLPTEFTVDATTPEINVKFTDTDTEPQGNYYKSARTAIITIDELHFNAEKASTGITVKGNNDGESVNAVISDWTDNGTVHTATVSFTQDAEYNLAVSYADEAGNVGTEFKTDFYIDNIDPELRISVNDNEEFNAYANEVIPVIHYQDSNLDNSQVTIEMSGINVEVSEPKITNDSISFTLTGKSGKSKVWTGKIEDIIDEGKNKGKIYGKMVIFDDFPSDANNLEDNEFDDIYTISVSVKDKAGRISNSKNLDKNSLKFSINRFGSTYDTSQIQPLLGTYAQEAQEIIISEINPNALKEYSVVLFKNNETLTLKKGTDYDVVSNNKETEWHEYIYKIHKDIFDDDGIYSITLNSKDKAGNVSNNMLDTKNIDISFWVDKTPPTAVIANLKSNHSYYIDENEMTILMSANDNLKLSEVTVYLDDEKTAYQHWNENEIETNFNNGEFSFKIEAEPLLTSTSHQLKVICKDASGRENNPVLIDGFKIIVNKSVKSWTYFGIIAVVVLVAGTVITTIVIRKRKQNIIKHEFD